MELIFSTTSMCKQAKIFFNDFVVSEWESERKTMSNFIISYFITSLSLSFFFFFFSHVSTLLHHSSFPRVLKIKLSQFAKVEKKVCWQTRKKKFYLQKNRVMIHCGMSENFLSGDMSHEICVLRAGTTFYCI